LTLRLSTYSFSVAPYDVDITANSSYNQGQQLKLMCSSEGGPQLEYSWLFADSIIANANTDTLTINNVNTFHGGEYTCNVTNYAGYNSSTITVYGESLYLHAL